jgi:hypothetical protein
VVGDRRRFRSADIEKYLAGRTFQHHQRG